jgi:hypothetical protein
MLESGMKQGGSEQDTGTCRFAARMMQRKGIVPITLLGYGTNSQVTYDMLQKVCKKYPNIRYAHIFAHGNYLSGFYGFRVPRTIIQFNDGIWPAHNSRMWTENGRPVPGNYVQLSSALEKAPCLALLPFTSDRLRIVVLESCYALRNVATEAANWVVTYRDDIYQYELRNNLNSSFDYPYSDMCFALNVYTENQMMLGSGDAIIEGVIDPYYTNFFNNFWRFLGDGESAYDAYSDTINKTTNWSVLHYHRIRGASPLFNVYLTPNP